MWAVWFQKKPQGKTCFFKKGEGKTNQTVRALTCLYIFPPGCSPNTLCVHAFLFFSDTIGKKTFKWLKVAFYSVYPILIHFIWNRSSRRSRLGCWGMRDITVGPIRWCGLTILQTSLLCGPALGSSTEATAGAFITQASKDLLRLLWGQQGVEIVPLPLSARTQCHFSKSFLSKLRKTEPVSIKTWKHRRP